MKRIFYAIAPLALLAGCVVRTVPYQPAPYPASVPAPAPRYEAHYYGQHVIPEDYGGGWCYVDGPHSHEYAPDNADWYEQDAGYWYYRGPFEFTYYSGHPLPGGYWCPLSGPHTHDFYPPRGSEWHWRRGYGWSYQGPYHHGRPPPPTYWPRPLPAPPRVRPPAPRPSWDARPDRPRPPDVRPEPPRPDVRPEPRPGWDRPRADEPVRPMPPPDTRPGWNSRPEEHGRPEVQRPEVHRPAPTPPAPNAAPPPVVRQPVVTPERPGRPATTELPRKPDRADDKARKDDRKDDDKKDDDRPAPPRPAPRR